MNTLALHAHLTGPLGLIPETVANPVARTYFHGRIDWHPGRSTRVFRVLFGADGEPARLQLCASSDNNNCVLVQAPFSPQQLAELAAQEIALIQARLGATASPCHAMPTGAVNSKG